MIDYRLSLMCGTDIPIIKCQLIARQPRIKEIALIGEKEFFTGIQTLCVNKDIVLKNQQISNDNITNFQIFIKIMSEKEAVNKKEEVVQAFSLIFPNYKVSFTPNSILFIDKTETIMVDQDNFEDLQNVLKMICCINDQMGGKEGFNPKGKKAEEIAQKLLKGRERIAKEKGELGTSIFTQYLSILTIGLNSMSLNDLMNLTIFQLYDLIERYKLYTDWDIDVRSRLAGGKPENRPDNWMKNIHN